MLELLFYENLALQNISSVAAPESFNFPACNFIKEETTGKMFFCEFAKFLRASFFLIEHLGVTASCIYL